jgi:hypothetical protein
MTPLPILAMVLLILLSVLCDVWDGGVRKT